MSVYALNGRGGTYAYGLNGYYGLGQQPIAAPSFEVQNQIKSLLKEAGKVAAGGPIKQYKGPELGMSPGDEFIGDAKGAAFYRVELLLDKMKVEGDPPYTYNNQPPKSIDDLTVDGIYALVSALSGVRTASSDQDDSLEAALRDLASNGIPPELVKSVYYGGLPWLWIAAGGGAVLGLGFLGWKFLRG